jgi:hypothetical protein
MGRYDLIALDEVGFGDEGLLLPMPLRIDQSAKR